MLLIKKNKKGISPILATILMVAFTVAIAGFVSTWMNQTVKTQTENAVNNSDPGCTYASLEAVDIYFNSSGTEKLKFNLRNTGTRTLTVDKIRVVGENSNNTLFANVYDLYAGDELPVSLQIDSVEIDTIASVRIIPKQCPTISFTIDGSEIN